MKVPKKITEYLNKKQDYINKNRAKLENSVTKLQSKFLEELLADILPDLTVKDGSLLDVISNYRKLSQVDAIFEKWTKIHEASIVPEIVNTTYGLVNLTSGYMGVALADNLPKRFDKVIAATAKKIDMRVGLQGGEIVRGGFLDSFLTDKTMATQVKNYIAKSLTGQIDTKEFIRGLGDLVNGDEGKGLLQKQYERFGYDLYQQYDRSYNSSLADEFDMNYFIYQGGLIDDTRDFCAAHNNKVWTRDEAEDWAMWTPSMGEYPDGYVIKSKAPYEVPSYLGYPGYQPLIDAGGYNCRHMIGWISDEMAFDLRPDLKP